MNSIDNTRERNDIELNLKVKTHANEIKPNNDRCTASSPNLEGAQNTSKASNLSGDVMRMQSELEHMRIENDELTHDLGNFSTLQML